MEREKILVVEDERIIAIDLQRRLEKFGYHVTGIASNSEKALELIETVIPDIVLMDINLPGKTDGIETACILRKEFHIPVIFLTAFSDEKTLERAKRAEPFGYILKPFKEKELYTTIDIALYKYRVDIKLKEQERWLSAVLNSVGEGIIAGDNEGAIRFINPAARKIIGISQEKTDKLNINDILSLHDENGLPVDINSLMDKTESSGAVSFEELVLSDLNNKSTYVSGSFAKIFDSNKHNKGNVVALRDLTEMKELSNTISYQASHDALTGLLNRDAFSKELAAIIEHTKLKEEQHVLIYLDLDQFKIVNDTVGHAAGDELLKHTTRIIQSVVRSSDHCARLGGDQFGILLLNTEIDPALLISQRLHEKLNGYKMEWEKDTSYNIKSSIGIVNINKDSKDIYSVLAAADDACYLAKDQGGNRIRVYKTTENQFQQRRGEMQWVSKLTRALEENRFVLYFQTIQPLRILDESHKKCEILIRMIGDNDEIIPPIDFLPAAERYKFMPAIDRWVIDNAFATFKEIRQRAGASDSNVIFSINLSAGSLAEEGLLNFIIKKIDQYSLSPKNICFEVTETAAISNMNTATRFITDLKETGFTFALDDFGSGFSSFNYLKNLPLDYLKIDGSFVKGMHTDPINKAMVEAINKLGQVMGVKTIAEFAANSEIITMLKQIGVDFAQGYEIDKPRPIDQFTL